ncbi:MAG: sigma factor, partial [Albidovulum sp.]|uniref:sigma factor n=1 Tax=Albidovulum sp. TaxID=1872424 RepID=UPI003CC4AC74
MTDQSGPDPAAALQDTVARDRGRLLSALIRELRDFQLAEDALQDAAEAALVHWARSGVPTDPRAWLLRVGRRKAID